MHAHSTKVELLPVTQADREAAAALGRLQSRLTRNDAADLLAGNWDDWSDVQAFARHRLAHSSHGGEELREAQLLEGLTSGSCESVLTALRVLRRAVEETGIHHTTPSVKQAMDHAAVVLGRGY